MRSQATKLSEHSSYRRRINRIISMLSFGESSRQISTRNGKKPPLPHITIDHKTYYDTSPYIGRGTPARQSYNGSNGLRAGSDETGVVLVNVPSATVANVTDRTGSTPGIIDITQKPSPSATVPVSPVSVSVGGSQSLPPSSQTNSRPQSNTYSIPISFSLRHIRGRSQVESGEARSTGGSGNLLDYGSGSASVGHQNTAGDGHGGGEDKSVNTFSTIVFAKPRVPGNYGVVKGTIQEEQAEVERWSVRKGMARAAHSLVSGLGAVGRWKRKSVTRGAGAVYPFVGVSSSSVPSDARGRAVGGGGLIVLETRRSHLGVEQDDPPKSRTGSPQGTETEETELTPLSYAPPSYLSGQEDTTEKEQNSPGLSLGYPPTRQSYVARHMSMPAPLAPIEVPPAVSQGRHTAPAAVSAIRQLPPLPTSPSAISPHSQATGSGDILEGGTQMGRPIRALPPLPAISEPGSAGQPTPGPGEARQPESSPFRVRRQPVPRLTLETQKRDSPGLSPHSALYSPNDPRHTPGSNKSTSTVPGFLNVHRVSPFYVDFLDLGGGGGSAGGRDLDVTHGNDSGMGAQNHNEPDQPAPPRLLISTPTQPEAAGQTTHRSFLDLGANSSSSSVVKGDSSSPTEPSARRSQGERLAEGEEDRATFGQARDRTSMFYYSSAGAPLPSPSEASHQTHQTYKSEESRLSWPQSRLQNRRHASWRTTFGIRREEHIPEETSPLASPASSTSPGVNIQLAPITTTASTADQGVSNPQQGPGLLSAISSEGDQSPNVPRQDRSSYASISTTHVHPFSANFSLHQHHTQYHPFRTSTGIVTSQMDPTSASTDEVSPSSFRFRAGAIRRTSSGDAQPTNWGESRSSDDSGVAHANQPTRQIRIP
ncbi:hypothetical protein AX15_004561 [Amanita polypyramis BW_CC]|nr:hypothetical protein AX15_004561 [Amanita polypyramis BW_CC]